MRVWLKGRCFHQTFLLNDAFFSTNDVKHEVFGEGVIICNDEFEQKLLIREKRPEYRDSPDSTVFVPPGNRTIAKTVLIGD